MAHFQPDSNQTFSASAYDMFVYFHKVLRNTRNYATSCDDDCSIMYNSVALYSMVYFYRDKS